MVKHGWVLGGSTRFWGGFCFIVVPLMVLHIWLERAAKGLRGKGVRWAEEGSSLPFNGLVAAAILLASHLPGPPCWHSKAQLTSSPKPRIRADSRARTHFSPSPVALLSLHVTHRAIPSPAGTTCSPAGPQKGQDGTPSRARVQRSANNVYSW